VQRRAHPSFPPFRDSSAGSAGTNAEHNGLVAEMPPPEQRRPLVTHVLHRTRGRSTAICDTTHPDARLIAGLLFELTPHLPANFARYINRLLLIASGRISTVHRLDHRVRAFAAEAGCDGKRAYYRFRVHIDDSLAKLLNSADVDSAARRIELAEPSAMAVSSSYDDDDCTPGAIILSFADRKPSVGIISKVEQQSWNTLAHRWEKTTLVRFHHGEQRIHPHTQNPDRLQRKDRQNLPILLQSWEVMDLIKLRRAAEGDQHHDIGTCTKAS
jgi:hypothetical protein